MMDFYLYCALAGVAVLILGIIWTWEIAIYELLKKKNKINSGGRKCQRRIWKESWYRKFSRTVPVEGLLKLAVAVTGLFLTLKVQLTGLNFMSVFREFLLTMIFIFMTFSGFSDVVGVNKTTTNWKKGGRVSLAPSFGLLGLLFLIDTGTASWSQRLHIFLATSAWICTGMIVIEYMIPLFAVLRCLSALVLGSWLLFMGITADWLAENQDNSTILWINIAFAWHWTVAIKILLIFIIAKQKASGNRLLNSCTSTTSADVTNEDTAPVTSRSPFLGATAPPYEPTASFLLYEEPPPSWDHLQASESPNIGPTSVQKPDLETSHVADDFGPGPKMETP
jgi:hypothetical protein